MVYVLFETPGGFALFKVVKDGKLKDIDNLYKSFETSEGADKIV
jgi:nucleolar protein 58